MRYLYLQTVSASLLVSNALSIPFSGLLKEGKRIPLINRSFRQNLPLGDHEDMFDPTVVSNEIRGVLSKYEQSARHLTEVDLNATTNFLPAIPTLKVLPVNKIVALVDYYDHNMDILYYGSVTVGTPEQTLSVQFDTGSADLWLPANCLECHGKQFKPDQSQTYKSANQPFEESYGRGEVSGTVGSDVVRISGMSVNEQVFGSVSRKSAEFARDPNDGLLGLAFSEISQTRHPTFFENLVEESKILPVFSVHLTRRSEGSEVCFGCRNESLATGPAMWIPLISRTYWSILMDGLSVNSTQTIATRLIAAIDTGTSLIYVPDPIADEFYRQIPGSRKATQFGPNFYSFPCDSPIAPSLSFNGTRFGIEMSDFNLGKTGHGSPDCVGGIMGLGDFSDELAIVGAEFMKSWYTTFDAEQPGRIGFAPSINNRGH